MAHMLPGFHFVTGFGVFAEATTENALILDEAIKNHGKPAKQIAVPSSMPQSLRPRRRVPPNLNKTGGTTSNTYWHVYDIHRQMVN